MDHRAAFARYERTHRRLVEPKQRGMARAAALLVPTTQTGIAIRNFATRLWPLATGLSRLERLVPRRRLETT